MRRPVQTRPRNQIQTIGLITNCYATLAQLVERNLAKVEVTSSNLVCRSIFFDKESQINR